MTQWKVALDGWARSGLHLIYPDVYQLCHGEASQPGGGYIGAHCLVPVPLHTLRFRERGFNQAEQLCQNLGRATGLKARPAR